MKNSMNRQNHRNCNLRSNYRPTKTDMFLCMAMSLLTFGMIPYSFLRNMVSTFSPFDGLTTRQMRDMSWLKQMYSC